MPEEDGDLFLFETWVNLRIILYLDHAALLIRGNLTLKSALTDDKLQKISTKANFRSLQVRYAAHRCDDGDVGLVGNYVVYFPFCLNVPDLIYSICKFVDTLQGYYEENKSDEQLFPISV